MLVGILNTLFGYGIFALLIFLSIHYSIAVFISTVLGVLFNFRTIGKLVFNHHHKNYWNSKFIKFMMVYMITYFMNIIIIKLLLNFNTNIYLAGMMAILFSAMCSYGLNKKWVFYESNERNEKN